MNRRCSGQSAKMSYRVAKKRTSEYRMMTEIVGAKEAHLRLRSKKAAAEEKNTKRER